MKADTIKKCAEIVFSENDPVIGCIDDFLSNTEYHDITVNNIDDILNGADTVSQYVNGSGITTAQIIRENYPEKTEKEIDLMFKTVEDLSDKMLKLETHNYRKAYTFILNLVIAGGF